MMNFQYRWRIQPGHISLPIHTQHLKLKAYTVGLGEQREHVLLKLLAGFIVFVLFGTE